MASHRCDATNESLKPCHWIERYGKGPNDFHFCMAPSTEVWKRKIFPKRPPPPEHAKLLAFAPEIFYCRKHGLDGDERRRQQEWMRFNITFFKKKTLEHFDVCVITKAMSDTPKIPQSFDLINSIKQEAANTIEQLKNIDIKAEVNINAHGVVTGPAAILITKVNLLGQLVDISRSTAAFENLDRRITAMARAGNDLRSAFIELTDKKDPAAKEWIESIVKAWNDAVVQ